MYVNETMQNTVQTVQNTVNTSTHITKHPTLYIRASVSLLHFFTDLDKFQRRSCVYKFLW